MMNQVMEKVKGETIPQPFPKMSYDEAMERLVLISQIHDLGWN